MPVWDKQVPQSLFQVLNIQKLRVIAHQKQFQKVGERLCGLVWVAVLLLPETAGGHRRLHTTILQPRGASASGSAAEFKTHPEMMHHGVKPYGMKGAQKHGGIAPWWEETEELSYSCLPPPQHEGSFRSSSSPRCSPQCCFGDCHVERAYTEHKAVKNCLSQAQHSVVRLHFRPTSSRLDQR